MKTLVAALTIFISSQVFAQDGYTVTGSRWGGEDEVTLTGVTGDLFATHELLNSRGPGWKKQAIAYIEDKTDAIENSQQIEDGTIAEHCNLEFENIEMVEVDSLSYEWGALKPVRARNGNTILYTVSTYADYRVTLESGKVVACPYFINDYVFLNKPSNGQPFKFLGKIAR